MTGRDADAMSASYAEGVRDERARHQALGEHWTLTREVFRGLSGTRERRHWPMPLSLPSTI